MIAMEKKDTTTDRIEKRFEVRAPRSKVWRAISDAKQFSAWFGIAIEGQFIAGHTVPGKVMSKGYEHLQVEFQVQTIDPERYFAYRWHPYANDPKVDYAAEPTTLVEFTLEETAEGQGTEVTIVESGFDRLPTARRAEAFRMNDGGWVGQVKNLTKYVA
jgi:uncharacterized protein YndB with AHSA1/START domain